MRNGLDEALTNMFSSYLYTNDYLFYAHMIAQCKTELTTEINAPAGIYFHIDRYVLLINPILFNNYNLEKRLAILKHEMEHILNQHVQRKEDKDHKLWNYATDCAINQLINTNHLGKDCVLPSNLSKQLGIKLELNQSADYYYKFLEQNKNSSESPDLDGEFEILDNHDVWEESKGSQDYQKDLTKKMIETSAKETQKVIGKLPKDFGKWLELSTRKAQVNWKRILKSALANKRSNKRETIHKRDRRFPHRTELKGKTTDYIMEVLIIADVSGSVDDKELLQGIQEVKHICNNNESDCNLIQIDTTPKEPEIINTKTNIIERKGTGGTNLFPAIEKAREHKINYDIVVVITDGELFQQDINNFKKLKQKVFWLITEKGTMPDVKHGYKLKNATN